MEEKDIDQKAIRTYESDIAEAIQHRQTSQASMVVAAEEKKHQEEKIVVVNNTPASPKNKRGWSKNILMLLISLIILCAGIWVVHYFYMISPLSVQQPATPAPAAQTAIASVVTPDLQKVIDVSNLGENSILNQINKVAQANPLSNGGILETVLAVQASTTANGKTSAVLSKMTESQFISIMNLLPPEALTSSLTSPWMLGFYSSPDGSENGTSSVPFVIFTTNFFQNAFAGMLQWESTMPSDLSAIFGIQSAQWATGSFHDKLVKNKNVREFTDSNGNTLFLYSFIDSNTLVITQNEDALGAVIDRFESQAYIR